MLKIQPLYHTIEIGDSFRFSTDKVMNLNEVLLRILGDEYVYYGSIESLGFDVVWIKASAINKLENMPNFGIPGDYNNLDSVPITYTLV